MDTFVDGQKAGPSQGVRGAPPRPRERHADVDRGRLPHSLSEVQREFDQAALQVVKLGLGSGEPAAG